MTEIVRSFCPQCGARDAAMVIPGVPFSVMCSKCGISMVRESGAPSLSPIPPTDFVQVPIEDVKPGDVARCNGREFPVMPTGEDSRRKWYVNLGSYMMANYDASTINALGFTFHRKVKREPRKLELRAQVVVHDAIEGGPYYSLEWCNSGDPLKQFEHGTQLIGMFTEILDGEDGA